MLTPARPLPDFSGTWRLHLYRQAQQLRAAFEGDELAFTGLFACDVSEDRRRSHVAAVLQEYGDRIFLCRVKEDTLKPLTTTMPTIIDTATDSIHVFRQCRKDGGWSLALGMLTMCWRSWPHTTKWRLEQAPPLLARGSGSISTPWCSPSVPTGTNANFEGSLRCTAKVPLADPQGVPQMPRAYWASVEADTWVVKRT